MTIGLKLVKANLCLMVFYINDEYLYIVNLIVSKSVEFI